MTAKDEGRTPEQEAVHKMALHAQNTAFTDGEMLAKEVGPVLAMTALIWASREVARKHGVSPCCYISTLIKALAAADELRGCSPK